MNNLSNLFSKLSTSECQNDYSNDYSKNSRINTDIDELIDMMKTTDVSRVRTPEEETQYLVLMSNKFIKFVESYISLYYNGYEYEKDIIPKEFVIELFELLKYYKYICNSMLNFFIDKPRHYKRIKLIDSNLDIVLKKRRTIDLDLLTEIYRILAHMYTLVKENLDSEINNVDIHDTDLSLPGLINFEVF